MHSHAKMDNKQQLEDILNWQKKIYEEIKVIQFHLNIVENQTTPPPTQPKPAYKSAMEGFVGTRSKLRQREAMSHSGDCHIL